MLKRISIVIITTIITIGILSNYVKADEKKNYLEVVKDSSETKYLENKQGYITKKITQANKETGEVTVEIKLVNNNETVDQIGNNGNGKNTEIFLIVDESGSMYDKLSTGKTRRQTVRDSSKVLAKSILEKYKNVKIGVIKFADIAKMTSELTDNLEQINGAIDYFTGGSTDLYDALVLAKNSYAKSDVNKLAIILTDGEPNTASVSKDENGTYIAPRELTRRELINLQNSGVSIVTMMTEVTNSKNVEAVFGTPEKPTAGKYYYIADANITEVIEKNIYSDIIEQIHVKNPDITEVKVVDYFPGDILDNFEFRIENEPDTGKLADTKIDKTTKTITWDIEKLEGDKEANLKYKLKLKDMNNQDVLEKEIATNEKVVLTYKDKDEKEYTVILNSSPVVKLTKEKDKEPTKAPDTPSNPQNPNGNNGKDDTLAKKPIPQTGESVVIISSISIIAVITVLSIIQFKKNNYK